MATLVIILVYSPQIMGTVVPKLGDDYPSNQSKKKNNHDISLKKTFLIFHYQHLFEISKTQNVPSSLYVSWITHTLLRHLPCYLWGGFCLKGGSPTQNPCSTETAPPLEGSLDSPVQPLML